jgi:hypothetical protein
VIDGVGGALTRVTVKGADVELQPFAVVVTVYVPAVLIWADSVVSPSLQRYCTPPVGEACSTTALPGQIVDGPAIDAPGAGLMLTVADALPLQPATETTWTPRVTGPWVDVNVIAFVPAPPVIVPFVIVQA